MKNEAYHQLAENEESGWYYQARLQVVTRIIKDTFGSRVGSLKILDIGSGTGHSTFRMQEFGIVEGTEISKLAIELCQQRYPDLYIIQGDVNNLDKLLEGRQYDLIIILGVLYHKNIPHPDKVLTYASKHLSPGGQIIWSEAAYPMLSRGHDDLVEGARRFYPRDMINTLNQCGFEKARGWNLVAWAFPIGLALALKHKLLPDSSHETKSDESPPPRIINSLLQCVTYCEWLFSYLVVGIPFGVSFLTTAKKANPTEASN